jgi:hypothetical protein
MTNWPTYLLIAVTVIPFGSVHFFEYRRRRRMTPDERRREDEEIHNDLQQW